MKATTRTLTKGEIKAKYFIGIDPGVNTGFAVYDTERKGFDIVISLSIVGVQSWFIKFPFKDQLYVRVEDARKRKWFGNADSRQLRSGAGIREGVGSIKRDCQIWEEFLEFMGIKYEMVAPKNNKTKLDQKLFSNYTGWKSRTNEHARDAAMLVYGF